MQQGGAPVVDRGVGVDQAPADVVVRQQRVVGGGAQGLAHLQGRQPGLALQDQRGHAGDERRREGGAAGGGVGIIGPGAGGGVLQAACGHVGFDAAVGGGAGAGEVGDHAVGVHGAHGDHAVAVGRYDDVPPAVRAGVARGVHHHHAQGGRVVRGPRGHRGVPIQVRKDVPVGVAQGAVHHVHAQAFQPFQAGHPEILLLGILPGHVLGLGQGEVGAVGGPHQHARSMGAHVAPGGRAVVVGGGGIVGLVVHHGVVVQEIVGVHHGQVGEGLVGGAEPGIQHADQDAGSAPAFGVDLGHADLLKLVRQLAQFRSDDGLVGPGRGFLGQLPTAAAHQVQARDLRSRSQTQDQIPRQVEAGGVEPAAGGPQPPAGGRHGVHVRAMHGKVAHIHQGLPRRDRLDAPAQGALRQPLPRVAQGVGVRGRHALVPEVDPDRHGRGLVRLGHGTTQGRADLGGRGLTAQQDHDDGDEQTEAGHGVSSVGWGAA